MIDFELTEDHKALVQTVREFAQKEVAPHIKDWDEKQHFEPSPQTEPSVGSPHEGAALRRRIAGIVYSAYEGAVPIGPEPELTAKNALIWRGVVSHEA